eukprot:c31120_g1_i1 orf=219-395(+)
MWACKECALVNTPKGVIIFFANHMPTFGHKKKFYTNSQYESRFVDYNSSPLPPPHLAR